MTGTMGTGAKSGDGVMVGVSGIETIPQAIVSSAIITIIYFMLSFLSLVSRGLHASRSWLALLTILPVQAAMRPRLPHC